MISLAGLDPVTWAPHPLHDSGRAYVETNCYTDVIIELLAAVGAEPIAMLGAAVAVDFELDQWTFFKPRAGDLRTLYGLDVHEMQPYRSLPEQIAERLAAGQTLMPELDSFHLPDSPAAYGIAHVKSSVVAEAIDLDAGVLRYFHNAGYFELSGADYRAVFGLDGPADPTRLPPYVDLVRFDTGPRLAEPDLRAAAEGLLAECVAQRPMTNPFDRFAERLADDLPGLLEADLQTYHDYAFATVRMAGASFELLGTHLHWLFGAEATDAAASLDEIVAATKTLSFRLARRRAFDTADAVAPMAAAWKRAVDQIEELV